MADVSIVRHNVNFKDITGESFNSWTVVSYDLASAGKRARWICKCVCGTIKSVPGSALRKGESTGCGCTRIDAIKKANTSHGQTESPE